MNSQAVQPMNVRNAVIQSCMLSENSAKLTVTFRQPLDGFTKLEVKFVHSIVSHPTSNVHQEMKLSRKNLYSSRLTVEMLSLYFNYCSLKGMVAAMLSAAHREYSKHATLSHYEEQIQVSGKDN